MSPRLDLRSVVVALGAIAVLAGGVAAQRRFRPPVDEESLIRNVPYDGRVTFARIRYHTAPGGFYYNGLPAWAHGYPRAERDLVQILNEVTNMNARTGVSQVLALDDPLIFKYPLAYMTEAGFWMITDKEAESMRAYLLKGGFVIFDDFRDDGRGGGGWEGFAANMRRVLPDARIVDLDPTLPIFHGFFEIPSFDIVKQFYDRDRPAFRGIYEDNDPSKRLLVMINYNTDVANFWEFSASGTTPVDASNEAFKLGVNYLIYGLTH